MGILFSEEICASSEFEAKFNLRNSERVRLLERIREIPLSTMRRVLRYVEEKGANHKRLPTDWTIQMEGNNVLKGLGSRQVAKTSRAAISFYTYDPWGKRVKQVLLINFLDRSYSPSSRNLVSYIHWVFCDIKSLRCKQTNQTFSMYCSGCGREPCVYWAQ